MISVKPNRIYKLMSTDKNNGPYVYCIAPGQTNFGAVLHFPSDAEGIYSVISQSAIPAVLEKLSSLYTLVLFEDADVLTLFSEPLKVTLQRQENEINSIDITTIKNIPHYSRIRIGEQKGRETEDRFLSLLNTYKERSGSGQKIKGKKNYKERHDYFSQKNYITEFSVDNNSSVLIYVIGSVQEWIGNTLTWQQDLGVVIEDEERDVEIINSRLAKALDTEIFDNLQFVRFEGGTKKKALSKPLISQRLKKVLLQEVTKSNSCIKELNLSSFPSISSNGAAIRDIKQGYRVFPQNRVVKLKHRDSNLGFYVFCIANAFYYKNDKAVSSASLGILLPPDLPNLMKNALEISSELKKNPEEFSFIKYRVVSFTDSDLQKHKFTSRTIRTFSLSPVISNILLKEISKEGSSIVPYDKVRYNGELIYNYMYSNNKELTNCFVKLKNGRLAFYLRGKFCIPLKVPSETRSLTVVRPTVDFSCDVTDWIYPDKIAFFGALDTKTADVIFSRIVKLSKPLEKKITLKKFFDKLELIKEHPKVEPLYAMLMKDTEPDWDSYNRLVPPLLRYITDETLLNAVRDKKEEDDNEIFDYKSYKGTKGIFYSLNDEKQVFAEGISLSGIKCRFIKKFAYVPSSEMLSTVFDMLVADVDLEKRTLITEIYKGKNQRKATYPIKVNKDSFEFEILSSPSDVTRPVFNVIAVICNTLFKNYEHSAARTVIRGKSPDKSTTPKQEFGIIQYKEAKGSVVSSPATPAENTTADSISKGMHFRRGHWHSYWYGPRSSQDRTKKLVWVKETIVNRDSQNILIKI